MYITPEFAAEEVLVYLRKSRSDDALLTVEEVLQKHESILDEWAEKNIGGKVPEENKHREVVSGETIEDRPEMKELLTRIESPKIKAVLVVEVQRLSRGDLEDAGRLIKLLRYTNTVVITPQKTYDLRDDYDRDFFERELKRGNEFLEYSKKIMNRGRLLSVQQGNYIGSIAPYGYDKDVVIDGKRKCPTLKINEKEANVVRMIFDMYVNKGMGCTKIANTLDGLGIKPPKGKQWSRCALKDLLCNIHYIGKVKWNWRKVVKVVEDGDVVQTRPKSSIDEYLIFEGKHPAIIDEALFNAAMERHGRNPKPPSNKNLSNPLAGLIFCKKCGRALIMRTYNNKGVEKSAPRVLCANQTKCGTGSCLHSELLERVKAALKECIADFEIRISGNNKDAQKLHSNLIKDLETRLVELEEKEVNLWDKYTEEGMPKAVFDKLNAQVLAEKDKVNTALCEAKKAMPEPIDYQRKLYLFQDALDALGDDTKSALEKNKLLKACIDRIEYSKARPQRGSLAKKDKNGAQPNIKGWTSQPFELDVQLRV